MTRSLTSETVLVFFVTLFAFASPQVAQSPEAVKVREAVNKVLEDSGKHFREGLVALRANRRQDSGLNFDKSVEVFLSSAINTQTDTRLQSCYNALVVSISWIEFPSLSPAPNFRLLPSSCGWKWSEQDYKLFDEVTAKISKSIATGVLTDPNQEPNDEIVGFNSQEVNPSQTKLEPSVSNPLVTVVRAQAGDTVTKLAQRVGANAVEVAKLNGLLPNSVLGAGREVRIPVSNSETVFLSPKVSVRANEYSRLDLPSKNGVSRSTKGILCTDTVSNLIVQKLRLGMSRMDVMRKHPRRFSFRRSAFQDVHYGFATGLPGVQKIELGFYEDKLYSIHVLYDSSIKWSDIGEFQRAVSNSLGIQSDWTSSNSETNEARCDRSRGILEVEKRSDGYLLALSDAVLSSKRVSDYLQRLAEDERRRVRKEEEKKKAFKP